MTLALLWERYKKDNPDGIQYSRYCDLYREWLRKVDVVMRQSHRAGERLFSDFAGSTLPVINPNTGEVSAAHVFVAAMGASSFTYAEAFWSENSEAWCMGAYAHGKRQCAHRKKTPARSHPKLAVCA
ncbi:MAG: transposase [Candidatus Melainabacteria bacterium]|nr:transposase [Candidatus Melainabacteria bacterium]